MATVVAARSAKAQAKREAERANSIAMAEARVCLPCAYGVHAACRHYPQGRQFSRPGSERGKPCQCEKADHRLGDGFCSATRHSDWGGSRCGRTATAKIVVEPGDGWSFTVKGSEPVEVEVCGIHRSAIERRRANEIAWRAERDARDAADEERRRQSRSAVEWAERLRREFGVDATAEGRVVAVNAETLYGQISDALSILVDVVGDDHPFRPEENQ